MKHFWSRMGCLFIVSGLMLGCAAAPTAYNAPGATAIPTVAGLDPPGGTPLTGPGFEWVIFSEAHSQGADPLAGLVAHDGYWTPSQTDALALERALRAAQPAVSRPLNEYKRQYIGMLQGGKRLVYANLFCRTLGIAWQTTLVAAEDGGDCFFSLHYDIERAVIINMAINGDP